MGVEPARNSSLPSGLPNFNVRNYGANGDGKAKDTKAIQSAIAAAGKSGGVVFRTDLLPPPLPLNLNSNDDIVASDHLPVVMVFNYPDPALRVTLTVSNGTALVKWPALVGRKFRIETSTNFANWAVAASNLVAFSAQQTWNAAASGTPTYFRVVRVP